MRLTLAGLLGIVVMACAAAADEEPAATVRDIAYSCANGDAVSVRFYPDRNLAVLNRHGSAIELQQQPSGSGFIYSNGPNTIRGQGDDLTVEIGRMVPIQCIAVGS